MGILNNLKGSSCILQTSIGGNTVTLVCMKGFSYNVVADTVEKLGPGDGQWSYPDYDLFKYTIQFNGLLRIVDSDGDSTIFDIYDQMIAKATIPYLLIYADDDGNVAVISGTALANNVLFDKTTNNLTVASGTLIGVGMPVKSSPDANNVVRFTYNGLNFTSANELAAGVKSYKINDYQLLLVTSETSGQQVTAIFKLPKLTSTFTDDYEQGSHVGLSNVTLPSTVVSGSNWLVQTQFDFTPATANKIFKMILAGTGDTIQANRIAEWMLLESTGERAFNRVGGNTVDNNIIHFSERHWSNVANYFTASSFFLKNGGSNPDTLTEDFANNEDGIGQAARLQTGAGSTANGDTGAFNGMRIQGQSFTAGTYTLSVAVKSNTGSSQTMRMTISGGSPSSDKTITTSWTRVEHTFTHAGGGVTLYFIINGSGGTALDILFDKVKLELGSSATAYTRQKYDLRFGLLGQSEAIDPTWVTGKGVAFDNTQAQVAFGFTDTPVTTTNFSIHTIGKCNAASTAQNYLLSTVFGDNVFELRYGQGGTTDHSIQPAIQLSGTRISAKDLKLADDQVHHVAATYDGTTLKLYVDKILFRSAAASLSSVTINRLQMSYNAAVGGQRFGGECYYASIYNAAHNQTQVNNMYAALQIKMNERSITMAANDIFIMSEGDSITADTNRYTKKGIIAMTTPTLAENMAVVGDQVSNLVSRATTIDSYYSAARATNILSVLIGANDMSGSTSAATFVANLKSYCLARKAAGWTVLVCTVLPNTNSGFNAKRNTANAAIVADPSFYDGLCRFDLDSTMGPDAAASNTSLYADGVHPTNTGHAALALVWKPAVEALF